VKVSDECRAAVLGNDPPWGGLFGGAEERNTKIARGGCLDLQGALFVHWCTWDHSEPARGVFFHQRRTGAIEGGLSLTAES